MNEENLMSEVTEEIPTLLVDSSGPSNATEWSEGYELLILALEDNFRDFAKLLLLIDSKVNCDNQSSITPLHYAVMNGDMEIVRALLDRNANVNVKDDQYHHTSNCHAIDRSLETIYSLLVNRIVSYEVGRTPFYISKEHHENIITVVCKYCTNSNYSSILAPRECKRDDYTPLHYAVETGSWEITKLLLDNNADVNIKALRGTPLHIAAEKGHSHIVKELLEGGANINSVCRSEYTALHLAVAPFYTVIGNGHGAVVKMLLEYEADVNAQNVGGKTVLFCAVERGELAIVKEVLNFCPDLNNESNRVSLRFAICGCEKKYKEIVENLLEYGFDVTFSDVYNHDLLHAAIGSGYLMVVERLLRRGVNVNTVSREQYTPLHSATIYGQYKVVELLIEHRANVNITDRTTNTPLFYAVKNCDYNITRLLLDNGANLNNVGDILNAAITKGCIEILEILLPYLSDIHMNAFGRHCRMTPLESVLHASKCSSKIKGDIARLLLARGANPNLYFGCGTRMLHDAVRYRDVELVQALLEYNTNVSRVIYKIETALHISAEGGNEKITKILLDYGARLNAKTRDGKTALHIATQMDHAEVVETLLKYGAGVNDRYKGNTAPIHMAALKCRHRVLEILFEFGADVNVRDALGHTALFIAARAGHSDIVVKLLQNGADMNIVTRNNLTALDYALITTKLNESLREEFTNYRFGAITVFVKQVALLKEQNLFVNEKYLQVINDDLDLYQYYIRYKKELGKIKMTKVGYSNLSYYDILTKSIHRLVMCAKHESVKEIMHRNSYTITFPGYEQTMTYRLQKTKEREILYEPGLKSFSNLFEYELPHHIIYKVFSYLSNLDLKRLICANPGDE